MDQAIYEQGVDNRAQEMLEAMAERGGGGMWGAHSPLATGQDPSFVTEIVKNGFTYLWGTGSSDPLGAGPFDIVSAMLLLCRWEDTLLDETVDLIRRLMIRGTLERGNTENHWLMYYTGNLLAAERWGDEPVFWNGLPPEAMQAEATRWILGMIERTAVYGHHEYDSPQYHMEHVVPMIGIYEHTQDENLKHQAAQVLSILVADMALEYFQGAWAGGHSREGYRENTWTRTGEAPALHYLYFGGESFDPDVHLRTRVGPALVARYRPPALFAEMAHDQGRPCVIKKTRAPRSIYRHVDREARPVRKYTYLSQSFALGSTQVGLPGAPASPIDLVSWDLTWKGPKHQAKIVCNHPYRSPERFSAFLPSQPYSIGRAVGSDKPYLQWPDRLFGASPFEQMMQFEGTIVVLYRIPEEDEAPFVNLYLPKEIDWAEQAGWLFGNLEKFYVGLRPIGAYIWEDIREAGNPGRMMRDSDQINGWLLRLQDVQAGLVLEAVEAEDVDSFATFCDGRIHRTLDLSGWPERDKVIVETFGGRQLEMVYDGSHKVDGEEVDYEAYPLYEAPGVEAPLGSGRMVFCRGNAEVHLNFGIDPEKPLLPMRVVG